MGETAREISNWVRKREKEQERESERERERQRERERERHSERDKERGSFNVRHAYLPSSSFVVFSASLALERVFRKKGILQEAGFLVEK